jgi:2-oxo-4-hydroxy-4-carboxy-5-ureidoimidazoline decarboxylase
MVELTISHLNALDRPAFVAALGWIFEHSPWVAERSWSHRPFADRAALHASMVREMEAAAPAEQLALLQAHPDLGTRARISDASTAEQAGAGLDRLTPEEFARLQTLNAAYREKFGFPFLYAVKGSTKYDILQALERRLDSPPEREYQEALRQVCRIAEFRLSDTVQ